MSAGTVFSLDRDSVKRRVGDGALAFFGFLALGGHAHQTFDLISVQWVGAACLLCAALAVCRRAERSLFGVADLPLGALVVFATLSLLWTPVPVVGGVFVVKLCFFCVLAAAVRRVFAAGRESALMVGMVAALGQALVLSYFPLQATTFGGYANQNFLIEAVLMLLPWAGAFAIANRTRPLSGALSLGVLAAALWFALFVSKSKIPILVIGGLGVALLPFLLVRMGRIGVLAIGVSLVALAWGAALRGYMSFAVSLGDRAEIFFNTAALAWDRFPLGGGAGSFGVLYPLFQERHLAILPGQYLIQRNNLIGAAHSEVLQTFADFGVFGLAVFAWIAVAAVRCVVRAQGTVGQTRCNAAFLSLVSGAIAGLVGFPFQNPATLALAAIALGALTLQGPALQEPGSARTVASPSRAMAERLLAGTFAIGFAIASFCHVMAYREFRLMAFMRHAAPDSAFAAHVRAHKWAPWDAFIGQTLFVTYMSWSSLVDRRYSSYPKDRVELIADPTDIGPSNAAIFELSRRFAPYNFNLAYGRVQYLLNSRLHMQNRAELLRLFGELRRTVPNLGETLVLEAYFAVVENDLAALERVVADARNPAIGWRGPGLRDGFAALAAEAAKMRSDRLGYAFSGVVHLEW